MSKHLYWKLQTCNNTDILEIGSPEFNLFREKYKNYETGELMSEGETLVRYLTDGYKNPIFGKIYSLTLAFVEEQEVRIKYITGNEKDLILTFFNTINNDHFKDFRITHFGYEYLLPYLGTRIDMNGIKTTLHDHLVYHNRRSWHLTGLCIRDYYSGAGNYNPTLRELAYIFNLPYNVIEPADEYGCYLAGEKEKLQNSAVEEIFTIVNVHRSIMGESVLENLNYSVEHVEDVVEEKLPLLQRLYTSHIFSEEIKEEIQQIVSKDELSDEDRINLSKIILAHYQKKGDKVAIKKAKEVEVNEFVKTL